MSQSINENSECDREPQPPSEPTPTSHFTTEQTGNPRMTVCRCFRTLQTRQCSTLPWSQVVKVFCRQETPQVEEQEGSSEMHYFHQKNAVDLIKEFEDLIGELSLRFNIEGCKGSKFWHFLAMLIQYLNFNYHKIAKLSAE